MSPLESTLSRYPLKRGMYSSHSKITHVISQLPVGRVLDLGCGTGSLTSPLVRLGWEVLGIELDPTDAHAATANGLAVINEELSTGIELLDGSRFDVILAADILEHLPNPREVCVSLLPLLKDPHSRLIVSIPNVANILIRIQLLFGRFNYTDRGILDRTHLRFFTRNSLLELLDIEGLSLIELTPTPIPLEMVIPPRVPRLLNTGIQKILYCVTRLMPKLLGYQFVVTLEKKSSHFQ